MSSGGGHTDWNQKYQQSLQPGQDPQKPSNMPQAMMRQFALEQTGGNKPWQPNGTQNFGGGGGALPDYYGAAQGTAQGQQAAINQQTQANRPNINTNFASQNWVQGPNGQWTLNSNLNGGLAGLQGQFTNQLSGSAGADANQRAASAAYQQETSRLDPMWNQRQQQEQSQLAAQGLDQGSQAYQQQMGDFGRQRNDAYQSAMNNSIGLGNQAQQMNFSEGMQGLGGLQGLTSMPGFNAAGIGAYPNYLEAAGMMGGLSLQQSEQQQQQEADAIQGGATVAGAAIKASDERLKKNVKRLDVEAFPGVPYATFEYKHDPGRTHFGVIAQDLEQVRPTAVETGPDGIKRVDYSQVPNPFGIK